MKQNKSSGLIHLYEEFMLGKVINRKEISRKFEVDPRTITRYVNEINFYFINENKPERIIYSREKDGYVMETNDINYLTKQDILAMSKVLLESRGFCKNEMDSLIQKLLFNCINKDKKYIKNALGNEIFNYIEPNHAQKLIQKIWDLNYCIRNQKLVDVMYYRIGENGKLIREPIRRILEPQGILFSEYYFYLIAFIKDKGYQYPAVYRLDRINSYKVLKEGFKVENKDRFKEGEFRNRIQFMQSGKLQSIKFKFTGGSIEAVLDRLPTAEILSSNDGEYLIRVQVYGMGIKMWLLSQGEYIEVLEPQILRDEMKKEITNMYNKY